MVNLAHDVSRELRDFHGRWTKGGFGGGLARTATIHPHAEVKSQLEGIPMNKGKRINGVPTGRSSKGYYVRLAEGSKSYKSSHHAATAIVEGKHNADGPGIKAPEAPRPPAAPKPEPGGRTITALQLKPGMTVSSGHWQAKPYGRHEIAKIEKVPAGTRSGGVRHSHGIYNTASSIITTKEGDRYHVSNNTKFTVHAEAPEAPKAPPERPYMYSEETTLRGMAARGNETAVRELAIRSADHEMFGKQVRYIDRKTGNRNTGTIAAVFPKDEKIGRGTDTYLIRDNRTGAYQEKAAGTVSIFQEPKPEPPKPEPGPSGSPGHDVLAKLRSDKGYRPTDAEHKAVIAAWRSADAKGDPSARELKRAISESQKRRRAQKAPPGSPPLGKPETPRTKVTDRPSPVPPKKPETPEAGMPLAELEWRAKLGDQAAIAELNRRKAPSVHHPQSLDVTVRATAEEKKRMRQEVLKATTRQAEVTPELVDKTKITVTKAPHGRRNTRALASHSGLLNTLHVKPEVLIGDNAQAVLDHGAASGWWSKTDKEHNLAQNVITHEFGHGVHGDLIAQGWLSATRHNPVTTSPTEHKFWTGLAKAMGASEPKIENDYYGRPSMDVVTWMARNKQQIVSTVSRYGSSNPNELMAELWTEYRLNSNPRPAAKYMGDWAVGKINDTYHSQRLAKAKAS